MSRGVILSFFVLYLHYYIGIKYTNFSHFQIFLIFFFNNLMLISFFNFFLKIIWKIGKNTLSLQYN